jgi:kumamolisin
MTTIAKNINDQIMISLYLKRDTHENGMTLQEYADSVQAGTQPILGHDEFVYQFGSTEDVHDLVVSWAESNGFKIFEAHRGQSVVKIEGDVGKFNSVFNITLNDITNDVRTYMMPDREPVIPTDIDAVIGQVLGFDQSFLAVKQATEYIPFDDATADPMAKVNPSIAVSPIQMSTAYKAPTGTGYGVCIGIFELTYSGYVTGYNATDVNNSFSRIGLTAPTITNVNVNGATVSSTSDSESMLDIYCAGGAAPRAKIAYYTAPNSGTQNIVDNILAAATDTINNPCVLGVSWGIGDGTSFDFALQACIAKGITVFVSSGDSGANNLNISAACCSQYMVSSGGTSVVLDGSNNIASEVAWSGSGGGISGAVSLPSWQTGLTTTTKTASSTGTPTTLPRRGVPDISAPADPTTGYQFYVNNSLVQYGGTSASAPLLAGIWARLTGLLGFRVPFNMSTWYSNPSLFNDITSGDNRNGQTTGYTTTVGWDPVTGLGSPKADQIYKYFHVGSTFPKLNYGFRPTRGQTYPRRTTGVR